MESSTAETKTLDNVEQFVWLFIVAHFALLVNQEINVDIGVNEIAVRRTPVKKGFSSNNDKIYLMECVWWKMNEFKELYLTVPLIPIKQCSFTL